MEFVKNLIQKRKALLYAIFSKNKKIIGGIMTPTIIKSNLWEKIICVPSKWSNYKIKKWINSEIPNNYFGGWKIKRNSKVQCLKHPHSIHLIVRS